MDSDEKKLGTELEDEGKENEILDERAESKPQGLPKEFFKRDREHSRYKRLILRNMLCGVFPYYWKSERRKLYHDGMRQPDDKNCLRKRFNIFLLWAIATPTE